ncbi:hypothetical protein T05_12767 [Trichinella murrelli]|uniref:Uncharacterized protein n=1 Tax=Trichinella murrelli TaxID=144512 RepID=A0A0V0T8L5_9BILA|nr:hypothetical protein T05_12767 [Trichinella murrelli]
MSSARQAVRLTTSLSCLPRQLPPLTIICFRTSGHADALQTEHRSATEEWRNVAARLSKRL